MEIDFVITVECEGKLVETTIGWDVEEFQVFLKRFKSKAQGMYEKLEITEMLTTGQYDKLCERYIDAMTGRVQGDG